MDFKNDTSKDTQLIYLSGAGLESFIWDDVRAKVTLPGVVATHDRQSMTTLKSVTHDILGQIQSLKASQYIIIAHSLSGVVGLELARALGDKLCGFIAVSATVPSPGKSFTDTLPFPQNFLMPALLKIVGTQPPLAAIRKGLCSDLDDKQAATVISTFKPEPRNLYTDKTSTNKLPAAKYVYIRTLDDKEVPVTRQNAMAKELPQVEIKDISGGHMVMMSHSDELAAIINQFISTSARA